MRLENPRALWQFAVKSKESMLSFLLHPGSLSQMSNSGNTLLQMLPPGFILLLCNQAHVVGWLVLAGSQASVSSLTVTPKALSLA